MPVPTIQIPNPQVHGDYHRAPAAFFTGIAPGTLTVKLGAILPPPEKKAHHVRFAAVLTAGTPIKTPDKTSWADKALAAIRRMYANDQYGDCTIAAVFHLVGGWTGNDTSTCVTVPDQEVIQNYMRLGANPGRDDGSIPGDVMAAWRRGAVTVNGKPNAVAGALAIDWASAAEVKAALYLFGGLHLSIDLPGEWANNPREWATPQSASRIVGGHSVTIIDYTADGVVIGTWGSTRFMPWSVLAGLNRNTELYAILSPDWTNDDRLAPNGVDVAKLQTALDVLGQGGLPDDPTPVPPPTPPEPPVPQTFPNYEFHGYLGHLIPIDGVMTPDAPAHAAAAISPAVVFQDLFAVYQAYKTGSIPAVVDAVKKLLTDLGVIHPAAFGWGDGSILKALIDLAEKLLPVILPLILK